MASNARQHRRRAFIASIIVSALAAALAIVYWRTESPKYDAAMGALLIAVALPWLGFIFTSIEFPGGWKANFDDFHEDLQQVKGDTASTKSIAEGVTPDVPAVDADYASAKLSELVNQYKDLRENVEAGDLRDDLMTKVFTQMRALAWARGSMYGVPTQERRLVVNWLTYITSNHGGERLAAYAWLHAFPQEVGCTRLVWAIRTKEDQDFAQYWAIQALRRGLWEVGESASKRNDGSKRLLKETLKPQLERLLKDEGRFPPGTDRRTELSRCLSITDAQFTHPPGDAPA